MRRGTEFKPEEIIAKLREAEVELARGKKVPEVCKQISVTEQTYYLTAGRRNTAACEWTRRSV
jgi:hypothetical protein